MKYTIKNKTPGIVVLPSPVMGKLRPYQVKQIDAPAGLLDLWDGMKRPNKWQQLINSGTIELSATESPEVSPDLQFASKQYVDSQASSPLTSVSIAFMRQEENPSFIAFRNTQLHTGFLPSAPTGFIWEATRVWGYTADETTATPGNTFQIRMISEVDGPDLQPLASTDPVQTIGDSTSQLFDLAPTNLLPFSGASPLVIDVVVSGTTSLLFAYGAVTFTLVEG